MTRGMATASRRRSTPDRRAAHRNGAVHVEPADLRERDDAGTRSKGVMPTLQGHRGDRQARSRRASG